MWPFKKNISHEEAQQRNKPSSLSLRRQLIDEAHRQWAEGQDEPVVSLEDFFTGNEDAGTIGANLNPPPGPHLFYESLKDIRSRPEVQDILVEIRETMEDDPDPSMWPFPDQIYILTSASCEEVTQWLAPLQPDEVDSTHINKRVQTMKFPDNVKPYRVWWD